jgi:histidine ammonia-lyase
VVVLPRRRRSREEFANKQSLRSGAGLTILAGCVVSGRWPRAAHRAALLASPAGERRVSIVLDGERLTLAQVVAVARDGAPVSLAPDVAERMARSRAVVERVLAREDAVYGMTTGLGAHKRHRVGHGRQGDWGRELIDSHRTGHGPPAPGDVVRACMLRLLNGFAKGTVGVRPLLAQRLVEALNGGATPHVRLLGSAGMADLAPLGDLAADLFADIELAPKEALALVNNNSFATGFAALALADAARLADSMTVTAALDLEAFAANLSTLDAEVARVRPYDGLREELRLLRAALEGSHLWGPGAARNLQDPLSYRGVVQVQGALRDALAFATGQLAIELNAHHDNPLVLTAEDRIVSVGCYDVLPLAQALDFARIALAPALTAAAERALKLLQQPLSGLPGGLSSQEGLGFGGLGAISWSAHALVAEARLLAAPVSFELATTTPEEGIADRITMAPLAARRLAEQVGLGHRILAVCLLCAAQALDLRPPARLGAITALAHAEIRSLVPFAGAATPYPADLEPLTRWVRSPALAGLLDAGG